MSAHESDPAPGEGAASTVAGFLAALAIFAAAAGLVYYPGRVGAAAVVVALVAAGIGGFQRGLAAFAVAFAGSAGSREWSSRSVSNDLFSDPLRQITLRRDCGGADRQVGYVVNPRELGAALG